MSSSETGFFGDTGREIAVKNGHQEVASFIDKVNEEKAKGNCSVQ